ncbi:DUF222 domain-containing protein [Geodermatophilus sp. DSM 45219]|uniref:DUF222 domain-containing protein n=1 Tax=Geodermatophilus sp. DSM 45219 TaxID=1881103 RepID=UPI0021006D1A|nr:DUF222 domain-containing protein [Geodermatophilus sp. DSM 45219]
MDGGTQTSAAAVVAPTVGWASGPLGEVQAASREISRQTAVRARALAAFAETRPASTDRQQGERGAMSAERWAARAEVLRPVSEWAAQELSIALGITTQTAERELELSRTLVTRLPRVLDALESGLLHPQHLWCLVEHVAPIADDGLRARVEGELLAWMAARTRVTTPAALGDRVRRVVARHNARDAARDLARALRQRGISLRPERTTGMSAVTIVCTTPEAQALYRALSAYVDALDADPSDTRSRGQKLVDCLMDLVLRPGESDLAPVQALLTLVAPLQTALGGDAIGEVDGKPVTAGMARRLVRAFAGLDPVATGTPDAGTAAAPDGAVTSTAPTADGPTPPATAAHARCTDGEPVDTEGGLIERAIARLHGAEFDRWLDDLVREAFGEGPAPGDAGWSPGAPPDPPDPPSGAPDRGPTPQTSTTRAARPTSTPCLPCVAAGGPRPTGRWTRPGTRCTPLVWPWGPLSGCCAPRSAPTPPTRPPGGAMRPGGSTPPPTPSPRSPRPRTASARSWPRCSWRPGVAGWPTGRASRSPTRSAAHCWR